MKYLREESGMALVMALILAVVTLTFSAALIFMVTQGTRMSGLERRYATALDAAKGGVAVITETIDRGGEISDSGITPEKPECLGEKLYKKTTLWDADNCDLADRHAMRTDYDKGKDTDYMRKYPDIKFYVKASDLEGEYAVYMKIIETIEGNSQPIRASSGGGGGASIHGRGKIEVSAVVGGNGSNSSSAIVPMHMPFLYTVEVLSEKRNKDDDLNAQREAKDAKARMIVLYAH